jgi:hypothetical protein
VVVGSAIVQSFFGDFGVGAGGGEFLLPRGMVGTQAVPVVDSTAVFAAWY